MRIVILTSAMIIVAGLRPESWNERFPSLFTTWVYIVFVVAVFCDTLDCIQMIRPSKKQEKRQ